MFSIFANRSMNSRISMYSLIEVWIKRVSICSLTEVWIMRVYYSVFVCVLFVLTFTIKKIPAVLFVYFCLWPFVPSVHYFFHPCMHTNHTYTYTHSDCSMFLSYLFHTCVSTLRLVWAAVVALCATASHVLVTSCGLGHLSPPQQAVRERELERVKRGSVNAFYGLPLSHKVLLAGEAGPSPLPDCPLFTALSTLR